MKRIVSLFLMLCICLSLATVLTACDGAVDNPYANFLTSYHNNITEYFENTTGTTSSEHPTDFSSVAGSLNLNTNKGDKSSFYVAISTATESFTNEQDLGWTDDVNFFMRGEMSYRADSNILKVTLSCVAYETNAVEKFVNNKKEYEWKDGFAFSPASDGTGTKQIVVIEYDLSKYFDDNEFSVDDATVVQDFDMQYLTDDYKGLVDVDHTYTERNPEWKATAMTHINNRVNAILAEVDKIIEKLNA